MPRRRECLAKLVFKLSRGGLVSNVIRKSAYGVYVGRERPSHDELLDHSLRPLHAFRRNAETSAILGKGSHTAEAIHSTLSVVIPLLIPAFMPGLKGINVLF